MKMLRLIRKVMGSLGLVLVIVIALSTVGCSNQSSSTAKPAATTPVESSIAPVTLVYTQHDTKDSWWVQNGLEPWMNEVEQITSGRIKIERHYGSELFTLMDAYDAAVKGTVDMAYIFPPMVAGRFPLEDIIMLTSSDKVNYRPGTAYWELIQQFPEWQQEYKDVHLLSVGMMFEPYMGAVKKPIKTLADVKGMQWLTFGALGGKRAQAWGFVPANVPPEDLFTSLQKGILDGCTVQLNTLEGIQLGQVLKYVSQISNDSISFAIVMNKNKWDSLPPDLQKIMNDEGLKLTKMWDEVQVNSEPALVKDAIDRYNIQFTYPDKSELTKFEAIGAPIRDQAAANLDAKGLPGTKVKDAFLQLEQKYSDPQYAPK